MKKVIEDQHLFRSEFKVIQEVNDGIQTSIYYIKYELQNSMKDNILGKRKKLKRSRFHGDGLKKFLTMNPMGKHIKKE